MESKPTMRVEITEPADHELNIKVVEMIRDDRTWDEVKVREVVGDNDAERILQILILVEPRPDKLIWPHTVEGITTARSAYHRIRERQDGEPAQLGG